MRVLEAVSAAAGTAAVVYMAGHLLLAQRPPVSLRGTIAPEAPYVPAEPMPMKFDMRAEPPPTFAPGPAPSAAPEPLAVPPRVAPAFPVPRPTLPMPARIDPPRPNRPA